MSSIFLEVENDPLYRLADYSNLKTLQSLLKNFLNIYSLAETGERTALVLYADLKRAIKSKNLTDLQRTCIIEHLVNKSTLKDVAHLLGKSESTVTHAVRGGIKNIQKVLVGVDDV